MNLHKIRAKMVEHGHTQKVLQELLKLSPFGFRLKLSGKTEFKASEIKKIADFYNISVEYFFT